AALHQNKRRLRDQEHSVQIRVDDFAPLWIRQIGNAAVGVGDTSIVDEKIERPSEAANHAKQVVDGVGIANVTSLCKHLDAELGQFPAGFRERAAVASGDD